MTVKKNDAGSGGATAKTETKAPEAKNTAKKTTPAKPKTAPKTGQKEKAPPMPKGMKRYSIFKLEIVQGKVINAFDTGKKKTLLESHVRVLNEQKMNTGVEYR